MLSNESKMSNEATRVAGEVMAPSATYSFLTRVVDHQVTVMLSNIPFECRGKKLHPDLCAVQTCVFVDTYITCIKHTCPDCVTYNTFIRLIHAQDPMLRGQVSVTGAICSFIIYSPLTVSVQVDIKVP